MNDVIINKENFPDPNFREALKEIFNKEVLSEKDLNWAGLEITLSGGLKNKNIKSIKGIELFKEINDLDLSFNQIEDISPLENIEYLTVLNLSDNKIKDASVLGDKKALISIDLSNNQIEDISFVKKWIENENWITNLHLSNNKIKDVRPVLGLKDLCSLDLSLNPINKIKDLPPFRKNMFPYLEILSVGESDETIKGYDYFDKPSKPLQDFLWEFLNKGDCEMDKIYKKNEKFSMEEASKDVEENISSDSKGWDLEL